MQTSTTLARLREEGFIKSVTNNRLAEHGVYTVGDLIKWINSGVNLSAIDGFGRRAQGDIRKILDEVSRLDLSHATVPGDKEHEADEWRIGAMLEVKYSWLTPEEKESVRAFISKHGHIPAFALLASTLSHSYDRSDQVRAAYYGIGREAADGRNGTAELFGITAERVRQIITEGRSPAGVHVKNGEPLPSAYAPLMAHSFITSDTPEVASIIAAEKLEGGFLAFAGLASLLTGFKVQRYKGFTLLVDPTLVESLRFSHLAEPIVAATAGRISTPRDMDTDRLLADCPPEAREDLRQALITFSREVLGLQSDGRFVKIPRNYVDVRLEIQNILEEAGRPLHLREIYTRFRELFPDHKATGPDYLRPHIGLARHVVAIGNQSVYGLDSWDIYNGSIRNLLIDTLRREQRPMTADELFRHVSVYFPKTTRLSIYASMKYDDEHRFSIFAGERFGLSGTDYGENELSYRERRTRLPFAERIAMFREYVAVHGHYPLSGDPAGTGLLRWFNNVDKGIIRVTAEQRAEFEQMKRSLHEKHYPATTDEHNCLKRCEKIKRYVEEHGKMPTAETDARLAGWYARSRQRMKRFGDLRTLYLTELESWLRENLHK